MLKQTLKEAGACYGLYFFSSVPQSQYNSYSRYLIQTMHFECETCPEHVFTWCLSHPIKDLTVCEWILI